MKFKVLSSHCIIHCVYKNSMQNQHT